MSYAIGYAIITASIWISAAMLKEYTGMFIVAGALTLRYVLAQEKIR